MVRLTQIREVIDGRRRVDDSTVRRLVLRATSKIADPSRAAEMHEQLRAALLVNGFAPALGVTAIEHARRVALRVVDDVEAASKPELE